MPFDFVAFDVDGTLFPYDTEDLWVKFLAKNKFLSPETVRKSEEFIQQHFQGRFNYREYLQIYADIFQNKSIPEMEKRSQEIFEKEIKDHIFPQAVKLIEEYKVQQIPVVLVTASNSAAIAPIAKYLAVNEVLDTTLEVDGGRKKYTGKIVEPYCYGAGKVMKTKKLCEKHGWKIEKSAYYADSPSDIDMLNSVQMPVAVNPKGPLKAEAKKKNWAILLWE